MKTLSATLEAAQKKPHRLPYVEAEIRDFEQGIKRLTWQRVYEGTEPDNHHGIAFDGQGSMHRIRVDTGLEYKKLIGQDDQTIAASVAADYHWSDKFVAAASGQMDLFRLKCSGTGYVKYALYADDEGSPGDLLAAVNDGQAVVAGWNELPFPPTQITQGTTYWLSFISNAQRVGRWNQAGNVKKYKSVSYSGFTFPDPAGDFDGDLTNVPDLTAGWQAASSAQLLFYQKQQAPFGVPTAFPHPFPFPLEEPSAFDTWTQIADDCEGPCAIAAQGARVYIFYRRSDNSIRMRYSHDYGENWDTGQLLAYQDVLSLAACWWGTGDNVVCFALKANELKAIIFDTDAMSIVQQPAVAFVPPYPHIITDTYGIGATFNPFWPQCEIIFAALREDDPYNHYNLFRTWLSDTYSFGPLDSVLLAPEGEDITYEYPDVHLPSGAQPYETNRIVFVERYAGIAPYNRPLVSHMARGTEWADAAFIEPKPLVVPDLIGDLGDLSSLYGLRLQSTTEHWWLSRPDGLWRAPRPAEPPLVITSHPRESGGIVSFTLRTHVVASAELASGPGTLVIELDNSRGQYAMNSTNSMSLRAERGNLTLNLKRSELELRLGYKTPAGKETVHAGTYWIDSWQYHSVSLRGEGRNNLSTLTLYCLDGWSLANRWTPRYQVRWNWGGMTPHNVWQILYKLLARIGICLSNDPPQPRSVPLDDFYPDFTLLPGQRGDTAIRRLLALVSDMLVFRGQEAFTKDPRPDEPPTYSYCHPAPPRYCHPAPDAGSHPILAGTYAHTVTTSRTRALGRGPLDERVVADAFDWDMQRLFDYLAVVYDSNLDDHDKAQARADAMLRKMSLRAESGNLVVPVNTGQELLDVVEVTDARCGIDQGKYRVEAIQTDYDRRKGRYEQTLTLGAP